jgi:hypothetical protein
MVQDALNAVCARVEGCETVAFVDLSTRMSLLTNDTTPESQDTLAVLTAEGVLGLQTGDTAMVGHPLRIHLFVKSTSEPTDALCCIVKLGTDIGHALKELRACIAKLSEEGAQA